MFPPAMPPSLSPMLILTMTMMTMSPLFPMLMSGTSAPRPRLPRPLNARPGGEHETLDPALVLAPPDPEVASLAPVEAPTVGHGPVPGPVLRLPPAHDPHSMVTHQPPLAEVTEAVDSSPVHQQVCVDLHHCLDWPLVSWFNRFRNRNIRHSKNDKLIINGRKYFNYCSKPG